MLNHHAVLIAAKNNSRCSWICTIGGTTLNLLSRPIQWRCFLCFRCKWGIQWILYFVVFDGPTYQIYPLKTPCTLLLRLKMTSKIIDFLYPFPLQLRELSVSNTRSKMSGNVTVATNLSNCFNFSTMLQYSIALATLELIACDASFSFIFCCI